MERSRGPQLLILLMLATVFFGAYYYYDQLAHTPPYLWLFVPDCPLYAAAAGVILLFGWPKNNVIRFVIACACALYGSWTIFVFFTYAWFYFGAGQVLITLALIFGHLGMVLQALLLLPKRKELGFAALALAWLWLGLNTFLDYGVGALSTHPWITDPLNPSIGQYTWAGSIVWPLVLLMLSGWAGENKWLEKLRGWLRWDKRALT
ncbi:MAG: DUF1405 domain-containing protein [Candidatus Marsarchaeota archaeon]|nr:DUF1405 domain-containing protein [Candidatus Marsarchaeota archaeon]